LRWKWGASAWASCRAIAATWASGSSGICISSRSWSRSFGKNSTKGSISNMKDSTREAIDTMINGNLSDFRAWLRRASKADVLAGGEYYAPTYGHMEEIVRSLRIYL